MNTSRNLRVTIGSRIRHERTQRDMQIEELAEMLNLSTAFIGLIERGQRGAKLTNLVAIAEIFELSLDDLILNKPMPFTDLSITNKEISPDCIAIKQATIRSLMYPLSVRQLDFIIAVIRSLKLLEHENTE